MNSIICEFCNTNFKTNSALNHHIKKAKYCLLIQGKIESDEISLECNICNKIFSTKRNVENHIQKCKIEKQTEQIVFKCNVCEKILATKQNLELHEQKCKMIKKTNLFQCEYCEKILSAKQMLENHKNICNTKKDKQIEILKLEKEIELKKLKEEMNINKNIIIEKYEKKQKDQLEKQEKNYKDQIEKQEKNYKEQLEKQIKFHEDQLEKQEKIYKEQLEKQDNQIKELQDKLDKIANKAIDRPTIVTNNNLNINTFLDFDDLEKIKNAIDGNLSINYIVDGQKGIAKFLVDTFLKDENGEPLYMCTDSSRSIFKYKNNCGELKKDIEAKKLTTHILDGGIKTKSVELATKWCKDDNGNINIEKFNIMANPQKSILNLGNDNSVFKKELASIISV